jgi:hypothetical protein
MCSWADDETRKTGKEFLSGGGKHKESPQRPPPLLIGEGISGSFPDTTLKVRPFCSVLTFFNQVAGSSSGANAVRDSLNH